MEEANNEVELEFVEDVTPKVVEPSSNTETPAASESVLISEKKPCCAPWTHLTEGLLHQWTRRFVVALSTRAAKHPWTCVISVIILSLSLAAIGVLTNFQAEFDQRAFLTPQNSLPDVHSDWIYQESGFEKIRVFWAALHTNGDNVLTGQAMRQAIETIETIQGSPDFENVCSQSQYLDYHTDQPTCRIFTVSQFWNHNASLLEEKLSGFPTETEQDAYVRRVVSSTTFPDGTPVFHEAILGNYHNETREEILQQLQVNTTRLEDDGPLHVHITSQSVAQQAWFITSAQALVFKIDLPDLGAQTDTLEQQLLTRLGDLRHQYKDANLPVQLEYFTLNAYQQEFQRAMNKDMPLVFVLVVVMISFTSFVFWRPRDKVQSRALLGAYAFITIGLSLLSGYGIMFLGGVPLTSVSIMIPFVVVGIALDDTFIITGAYFRIQRERKQQQQSTTSEEDHIQVIEETMQEVGVSISMTTWTTLLCFFLGSISSIPAVEWLCLYAATTIGVDFLYQITFFVALLTLDERRVQANRRDICFWIVVQEKEDDDWETNQSPQAGEDEEKNTRNNRDEADDEKSAKNHLKDDESHVTPSSTQNLLGSESENASSKFKDEPSSSSKFKDEPSSATPNSHHPQEETQQRKDPLNKNFMERFMSWYADRLMQPWVKIVVIFVFLAYFAGCVYSTTKLRQEFNVADYVPEDSMLTSFTVVFQTYTSIQRFIGVYFRNVDQSDPYIQEQMTKYVQELAELPQIGEPPAFFWVRDFQELEGREEVQDIADELGLDIDGMSFNDQLDVALQYPPIRQIYAQDIVRDEQSGNITASRTFLYLREIDMEDIQNQMDMLMDQREITASQPVNSPENLKNGELSFFTFDDFYFFWELYAITVDELIFTTVCCVAVVSFVALVYIPHWTAMAFVTPLIIMLYFMLLGTMQYCGIKINSITYFIIVMAIGLLVDFLMHILLRYYETRGATRHGKVKETLETMGASILLGGFTTWLGVIPLAFSTTKTFMTTFISFLAMVTLGCSVGLALLPVLLSLVGPVDNVDTPPISSLKGSTATTESQSTNDSQPQTEQLITRQHSVQVSTRDGELIELVHTESEAESPRFTLTPLEREEVWALKTACEEEGVMYRHIFELAKYVLAVRSLVNDNARDAAKKRTNLALRRLRKRRKWEEQHGMDQIDDMEATKELDEAAPGFFVIRYTTDREGHIVVGHHMAYAPYHFMFANKENLAKYLVAEQYRLDLGAADLEEARKGIAIVSVADGLWGIAGAYRYLRVLARASDNVDDMHPNRVKRVYTEIPVFGHHLIEGGKKLMPKKIAERVNVHHTVEALEVKLEKAEEGEDPMNIVEWCEKRSAVYQESVERVSL